jgi:hypothetical protein
MLAADCVFVIFFTRNMRIISGLIDFLLGTSTTARDLRRKCIGPSPMNCICFDIHLSTDLFSSWCQC